MTLSRSKRIHHTGHSVISKNACARARHAPTFTVTLTAVHFLFQKQKNAIFQWYISCYPVVGTLISVLWAYFISPLKIFILNGCWCWKRKINANRFRCGLGHGIQAGKKYMQTGSVVVLVVHAPGTRQHSLSRWQLFTFSSGSETMVSFNGIFCVLPSYVFWAYFISPLKIFILNGCWCWKRKIMLACGLIAVKLKSEHVLTVVHIEVI